MQNFVLFKVLKKKVVLFHLFFFLGNEKIVMFFQLKKTENYSENKLKMGEQDFTLNDVCIIEENVYYERIII